jgi:hypothetical protein
MKGAGATGYWPKLTGAAAVWWTAAIVIWLITIPLCSMLAHDLVAGPPPNLQTWKTVAELLPALPILVAVTGGVLAALRGQSRSNVFVVAAKYLLWCSAAVALLAIPKAP